MPEPQPEAERPEVEQPPTEPTNEAVAVTVVEDDAVPDSVVFATSKGFTMQEVTDYLQEQGFIQKNQPPSALSAEHDAGLMKNQVGFLGALGKARALKGGAK